VKLFLLAFGFRDGYEQPKGSLQPG